jgi:hypothetical protein
MIQIAILRPKLKLTLKLLGEKSDPLYAYGEQEYSIGKER